MPTCVEVNKQERRNLSLGQASPAASAAGLDKQCLAWLRPAGVVMLVISSTQRCANTKSRAALEHFQRVMRQHLSARV